MRDARPGKRERHADEHISEFVSPVWLSVANPLDEERQRIGPNMPHCIDRLILYGRIELRGVYKGKQPLAQFLPLVFRFPFPRPQRSDQHHSHCKTQSAEQDPSTTFHASDYVNLIP